MKLPGVTGARGPVLPTCDEQRFLDPNETRRRRPAMPILLNQIRLLAFIVFFCVGFPDVPIVFTNANHRQVERREMPPDVT
jgi:hypothetical protein